MSMRAYCRDAMNGVRFFYSEQADAINRVPTVIDHVEWVTTNEHHRVRVRQGPGQTNMTLWDTSDSGDVASHEFGHMLGHPDEYSSSACPNRSPVNTGTVMDDNTEVVARLCRPFCDRHQLNTYQV